MSFIKSRKRYLDADEEISDSVICKTKRKISIEEPPDQMPQSSYQEQQIQIESLFDRSESDELYESTPPDNDVSRQNETNSPDDEFDEVQGCWNDPKNLQGLLQSVGFCDPITASVERSPAELLLMILKYSISNELPLTSASNLMRLINSIFPTPVVPQSRYMIDKIFNPKDNTEFHATCPNCTQYVGKLGTLNIAAKCTNCQTIIDVSKPSSENYFAIIDPSDAIVEYLQEYEDYYNYIMRERCYEKGRIKDVYDGKCYRDFVNNLPDSARQQYVTASFNTDGAPVFESSTYSIWPIYLMINELPVQDRWRNLIVCGLWFGKSKPEMNVYLDCFVEKMNYLSTVGIRCTIKEESLVVKLFVLICCVDSVARAPINGTMQFNAFYGCDWCFHPGEWIEGSVRYPVLQSISASRDKENTVQLMKEAIHKGVSVFGVKNASPLINLHNFDIIEGTVPDHLHCIDSGVGKQLTEPLIKGLSKNDFELAELRLSKVKAPNQLGRLSRPLKDRAMWKAREWENWILYYSIPVLESIIDERVLKHWGLLVESLHILLKIEITYQELDDADRMLHEFVCGVEEFYSKSSMTYNVHQLLHIAKSVQNWGPLWAHSTFPFESGNHELLTAIKCAKGVNQQILRYVKMQRSVNILEKKVRPYSSEIVKQYCNDLSNPQTKKCIQIANITYFGSANLVDQLIIDSFHLSPNTNTFLRMVKNGCVYASCQKKNARSCNSFAQLTDKRFVKIMSFVVDVEYDNQLAICNIVQTTSSNSSNSLQRIIKVDNEAIAVKTTDIDKVCVFLNVTDTAYVCSVPNLYKY